MRFPVAVLCFVLVPGFALAVQKPAGNFVVAPALVLVQEEAHASADDPWRDECRWRGARADNLDCAPPRQRKITGHEKEKPPGVNAKKHSQAEFRVKQAAKKIANGAVGDHGGRGKDIAAAHSHPPSTVPTGKGSLSVAMSEERVKATVGQLLLSGFAGKRPADADAARAEAALRAGRLSGVVLSGYNISNPSQLRELLGFFSKNGGSTPPFIAIEQPGGPDSPLSEEKGFAFYASANAVAGDLNAYEAKLLYRDMAAELALLGATLNIGPSADVCREAGVDLSASCFGNTPSSVAAFASAFSEAHHDRGVLTALQHEPFRKNGQSLSLLRQARFAILREVMARQISDAIVIRVKATGPGSLPETPYGSPRMNLYRGTGFHGVLIFDLDMGSQGAPIRQDEVILRAFRAGADMVLIRDPSALRGDFHSLAFEAIQRGLKSGRLRMARLEEAYKRVQRLKERLPPTALEARISGIDRALASK